MARGLTGGSIAAVVASLVSLPLHSPSDALFNTLAVAVASLLVGLASGVVWGLLVGGRNPLLRFAIIWLAALALAIAAAFGVGSQIDRMASFGVPLAVIVFGVTGVAVASAERWRVLGSWRFALACMAVALSLGVGLVREGDQESGRLELPPRAETILVAPHELA